ncbi:hypothetical protein FAQ20_08415 [Morganella morganii]|nr:hypothetical protein [Morganella morganii]EGT3629432.1 hypothetical protein [Morganella morganii]EGT3635295.1 hypothetical protein [Morganella morganii]
MIIFYYFLTSCLRYTTGAAAQSAAGIGVPKFQLITGNISSMFPVIARTYLHSMVVRAGLPQGRPVSIGPGNANPVRAATNEIGVSGGSINISPIEAALWLLSLPSLTRDSFLLQRGCLMYDHTPLTPEELSDQCCALAFAIIRLEHPYAEELLMYVLWERINTLNTLLTTEVSSDE